MKWFGVGLICMVLLTFCTTGQAKNLTQMAQMQERAVQLARNGEYEQSLAILKQLADKGYQEVRYWQDYIVVLCWAGQEKEAILLAEQRYQQRYNDLPSYVLKALRNGYQKQKKDEQMLQITKILFQRGEEGNKLLYAEQLMTVGDLSAADVVYQEALRDPKIADYQVYYSRAVANLKRYDLVAAEGDWAKLALSLAGNAEREKILKDMVAQSAALLIGSGEMSSAEYLLKKYVDAGTATPRMLADYFIALRYLKKPVLPIFERLCPDWDQVPVYGMQNIGDMYFRQKQYKKAEKIYAYILQKSPEIFFARAARAYCLAMLGQEKAALAEYKLAAKYPAVYEALAADGLSYITAGRIHLARQVFALLGTTPEEKRLYQQKYANALAAHGEYHESQRIYQQLQKDPELKNKAIAGMAINKINRGLYQDAEKLFHQVDTEAMMTPEYSQARILYVNRRIGGLYTSSVHNADYKGNDNYTFEVNSDSYLGDNFYLLTGLAWNHLKDDQATTAFTQGRYGLSYHYDRGRIDLSMVHAFGDYEGTGLEFYADYAFNDLATLIFQMRKRPHGDAYAASQRIEEQYKSLRWEQRLDEKNTFALEYEWDDISDGNSLEAYSGEFVHNMLNTPLKNNNLLLNYSWSGYDFASDDYESPQRRVAMAVGVSQKWLLPKKNRSWEWLIMTEWGHDNDEPTDFSPYTRGIFTQDLSANQSLVLGAEYGWRTDRLNDTNSLRYGYYQLDLNYNWEW